MQAHALIALDIDGTLLNDNMEVTPATGKALLKAKEAGMEIVISTGRPRSRIPEILITEYGADYAITANGAAVYRLSTDTCLFEDCFTPEAFLPYAKELCTRDVLFYAFTGGNCYSQLNQYQNIPRMQVSEQRRAFFSSVSTPVDDLVSFLQTQNKPIQKGTIQFFSLADGTLKDRAYLESYLRSDPALKVANGVGSNLEFTKAGVSKAKGLRFLADYLGVPMERTIAVGDSENDMDIIEAAGTGIAMDNADAKVKEIADLVTRSNNEDGVAYAIEHMLQILS